MFLFLSFVYFFVGLFMGWRNDVKDKENPSDGPMFIMIFLFWPIFLLFKYFTMPIEDK